MPPPMPTPPTKVTPIFKAAQTLLRKNYSGNMEPNQMKAFLMIFLNKSKDNQIL
jgi:hypothetical protein